MTRTNRNTNLHFCIQSRYLLLAFLALLSVGFFSPVYAKENLQIQPISEMYVRYQVMKDFMRYSGPPGEYPEGYIPSPISPEYHYPGQEKNYHVRLRELGLSPKYPMAKKLYPWASASDSEYDLRDPNGDGNFSDSLLTPIRDQGACGTCWAFATYGVLEGHLKKRFSLSDSVNDYSEDNLKHLVGFDRNPCDPGNFKMSTAYMTRHAGPISESDDPYDPSSSSDFCTTCTPVRYVDNFVFMPVRSGPLDNTHIKQALIDYGPVFTSMYIDTNNYYNSSENTYYYPGGNAGNHAVVIVGWDDNKSVTGAPGNGAFIIRNSWGTGWHDNGYFYISYYDTVLGVESVDYIVDNDDSTFTFEQIYQHDPLGWTGNAGYSADTAWGANKFTPTEDTTLKAVGFYATSSAMAYEIEIYDDYSGGQFSNQLGTTQSGVAQYSGYYTMELDTTVPLTASDPFYVVVKFDGTPDFPIPVEYPQPSYSSTATASSGESYASPNGVNFQDMTAWGGAWANTNICIKALVGETNVNINTSENFPDANFRSAVETYMGSSTFTAAQAAAKTRRLVCSSQNIQYVTGIEFFTNLTGLDCRDNQIACMDLSALTQLTLLKCSQNNLESLDLSSLSLLETVFCDNNQLSTLTVGSVPNLTHLVAHNNALTDLDVSSCASLVYLKANNNQIATLNLNGCDNIQKVHCYNNNIADLTQFASVSGLGPGDVFNLRFNLLDSDDWDDVLALESTIGSGMVCSTQKDIGAYDCTDNINTPENFPDPNFRIAVENALHVARGEPFTAARAAAKTSRLICSGQNIQDVSGIEFFSNITGLDCRNNQISHLDLSSLTNLETLFCSQNNLETLDLSSNTSLDIVFCDNNQISDLTVGNNPNLLYLIAYNNSLTTLDLSSCSSLLYLRLDYNQLTTLNLDGCGSIQKIYCYNNNFDDLSYFSSVAGLDSGDVFNVRMNLLDSDDWDDILTLQSQIGAGFIYSTQRNIGAFDCIDNINTPENFPDPNFRIAVENALYVARGEPFTAADAAAKTSRLVCSSRDIQYVTGIEYFENISGFDCRDNQISCMDLSNLTGIETLLCSNNNLTTLNLSANSTLKSIFCDNNLLTNLTIGTNTNLESLVAENNSLTTLDLTSCSGISYLAVNDNQLTNVNLSGCENIFKIHCYNNNVDDLSSFVSNEYIDAGDFLDLRYNNLTQATNGDDISILQQRIGDHFYYTVSY